MAAQGGGASIGRAAARAHANPEHNGDREECPRAETSGTVVAMRHVPGFRIIENHYPAGLELPRHSHNHAYLSYVLEGPYSESYGNSPAITCTPGVLRYLPPDMPHANIFEAGSHCLLVEVDGEALKRVEEHTSTLARPGEIQGIASTWLAQRLFHEFRQGDELALVSIEGVLLEMLAEGARHAGENGPVAVIPRWLRIARDYLESNFLRPLSLAEIASAAGVHRVHLSREFRRYFSTTVGEFLRRKRIEHACQLVSTSNIALAEIAMTCGFADQSHFSATFRRQVGLTPARFRQVSQAR
ncbi:MAG TPA: AraC family transcriptional regulator [Bryobacteraceae bacterium]|nr:AraC family transcriptional regulator [Bryobacteraceae bacterium]